MPKAKQRGLGKGLNSIFGQDVEQYLDDIQNNAAEAPGRREVELPIEEIRPNPYQPRKEFDKKALEELSESIKTHGIFTPLLNDTYSIYFSSSSVLSRTFSFLTSRL